MKCKLKFYALFTFFILSLIGLLCMAMIDDGTNVTMHDIARRLFVALGILVVDTILLHKYYVDGKWKV